MMLRNTLIFTIACWLCSYTCLNAQTNALFTDFNGVLTPSQTNVLTNNLAVTSIKQNKAVFIDRKVFSQSIIKIDLFGNQQIQLDRSELEVTGINFQHWTGKLSNGNGTGAFLINGDRISGHFSGDFGNYEIYPLGNGIHIFAELDNEQFAACGNEQEENNRPIAPIEDQLKKKEDQMRNEKSALGTECFIRLIIAYTPNAKTSTLSDFGRTMNEHIGLAIMESNQGYANSNVELRIELAYSYASTDSETFFSGTDVSDLQSKTDGKWDEVHGFRDDYDGDMVCLVTGNYFLVCGQAFGFDYTDEANMFQVSSYSCIVGNYTFAHEFGHTQGCRHDNDNTGSPFSYAKGYNDGTERTVMAVSSNEPRRNYWSNPDVDFPGGGATGTVDRDNAKGLDEGDAIVASHRVTPNTASISDVVLEDHTLNMVAVNMLTSTNEVESGAVLALKSQGMIILEEGFHARSGSEFRAFPIPACTASYSITDESIEGRTAAINQSEKIETIKVLPNPFVSTTQIAWEQKIAGVVNIQVQNAYGQIVLDITQNQWFTEGSHTLDVNAKSLVNGLYYLVLRTEQQLITQPIITL